MDRKSLVLRAKIAESAQMWQDMLEAVVKIPDVTDFLVEEERHLFNVAFKNVLGPRRASLRIIDALIDKSRHDGEPAWKNKERVQVRENVVKEIKAVCARLLDVVTTKLLVGADADSLSKTEALVFFLKMAGDHHRYLTDVETGEARKAQMMSAQNKYEQASKLAGSDLPSTHPLRLGLALNYAVFFQEVKGEQEQAMKLASTAFEDAIGELDGLEEEHYNDATLLLQLLRDNLVLWGRKLA